MLKKIHKAWIMTVIMALIMIIGFGLFTSTNSVFIKSICEELGLPRGEYTFAKTVMTFVSIIMIPYIRKGLPKIGTKKMLLIGAVGMAVTNAAFALADSLWHFYIIYAVQGLFYNAISLFVAANYISRWFKDSIGTATSIAYAGTGLGGAIFSPVCTALIQSMGWRSTYVITSAGGLLVLLPLILLLLKESPEKANVERYSSSGKTTDRQITKPAEIDLTMRDVKKMPAFYILIMVFVFTSIGNVGPWSHTTAFLNDSGFSAMEATTMNSFYLICITVSKLLLGVMFDKFGKKLTGVFCIISLIGSPIAALFINAPVCPWLYCICLGFVGAVYTVGLNQMIAIEFGQKAFSDTLSVFTMITSFTGAFASPFMGAVFDATGSYRLAFIIILILSSLASVGMGFICFKKDRKVTD